MEVLTFKRGIHPPDEKGTSGSAIKPIHPRKGDLMVFPMIQNIGAPCTPLVAVGDSVLLGQKIAESTAFVSAPVHSSISGVVKEFRKTLTPTGLICDAVVIENDGENTTGVHTRPNPDYASFSKDKILNIIKEAGIVGLGGAGFPTHIKLNPPADKKIDTIIINASECEPYLTSDHRVLLEETDRFLRGMMIILKLFPEARGIIGIETNKPDAVDKLIAETANNPRVSVARLKPKYPQGSEKQLILACTKRQVPSGGLPADVGCIVINVDTTVAIERAVVRGRPLIRKIVTVAGGAANNPGNYKVRLGTTYRDFMEQIGGFKTEPIKLISGGPMMGVAMFSLDVPMIKTSSAFLCLTKEETDMPLERNCIRCGKCVVHCPMGLMPLELNHNVIHGEMEEFHANHGMDCMECGSCSYVCPSKRHIAQSIRATRRSVLEQRKK